ncbi:hypothetical protein BN903_437 [Halorubrum sp. AJ67]|nr:hypothetical protein BN903_437 [Halorubrum sp. AJ67]
MGASLANTDDRHNDTSPDRGEPDQQTAINRDGDAPLGS